MLVEVQIIRDASSAFVELFLLVDTIHTDSVIG